MGRHIPHSNHGLLLLLDGDEARGYAVELLALGRIAVNKETGGVFQLSHPSALAAAACLLG